MELGSNTLTGMMGRVRMDEVDSRPSEVERELAKAQFDIEGLLAWSD